MIAYHLRQSFKPGEITPEPANKIGYDLAMSLTKGKHALLSAPTLTSTTFTRMERI
nr:relaxase/mobilization nuclease domain-containing protein [uncultured Oscillibacter sp.]